MNVIVFSKDRPMQLNAYIESLLHFSDLSPSQIIILYRESKAIPYEKLLHKFSDCIWIKESKFDDDLREAINICNDHVMFGCDDVVFTGKLDLNKCIKYLNSHNELFGISLRLGNNISPYPEFLNKSSDFHVWDWSSTDVAHYNYPWELDATLYRKIDIQNIINQIGHIKSPNFLESLVADRSKSLISKRLLAFEGSRSKAIVITVNRVQETHPNVVDETINYSIERLNQLFNLQNTRIDFIAISRMPISRIHVGAEFMIFDKNKLPFFRFILIKIKRKILTLFGLRSGDA